MNEELSREVFEEEVWRAFKQMQLSKAPGPDGFVPCFYQQFWSIVGGDVVAAVRSFLRSREVLKQINDTYVTLIPEVKEPKQMTPLYFFRVDKLEYMEVKKILETYARASGQQIYFQKNCFSFSQNMPLCVPYDLADCLGVQWVAKHDKYLGLPTELSYSKEEAFWFLTERVEKRTLGWRDKTLSVAGKETLIKAVLQSIPNYLCHVLSSQSTYAMQCIKLWIGFGGETRRMRRRYIEWLGRSSVFISEKASILMGREALEKGLRYQIGDESEVSVWDDPWFSLSYNFKPYSLPMVGIEDFKMGDLIDAEEKEWILPLLHELFSVEEHYEKRSVYRVKSGYHLAQSTANLSSQASSSNRVRKLVGKFWHKVWKTRVPPKVRTFVWRLCKDVLPTRVARIQRIKIANLECAFCHNGVEMALHLFKDCPVMRCFWLHSPLQWVAQNFKQQTSGIGLMQFWTC
ncbi:uncharacterized protein LOC133727437 [Rosa rugosa]|uniref:uncharacterized protein LOC133727437 n=1 Tax=Rosa rugosa TaxID=74645 RepID=UPI002B40D413|nr:uncharacterized protein LOC133727437 [Rosa rugosa]